MDTKFPIPSTYSRIVARLLGLQERELGRLLQGTGLSTDILMPGDETHLSGTQQLRVLENGLRILGSPEFGLKLGQQLQPSSHGPLGYLALSSHDLMSSLESLRDYLPVRLPLVALSVELDADWLSCTLHHKLNARSPVRRSMCESFALVIQSQVEAVLGRAVNEGQIQFEHAAPAYREQYANYLHSPCHFGCEETRYQLPATLAYTPNAAGDPDAYRLAQELCSKLLNQIPHRNRSWSERVRTLVLAQPQGSFSEEQVARALFVSKRTLARRLAQEHTSYRAIKEAVLAELSKRYLVESRQTVESVAALLGYHDSAALRKAFRRWTGMTPQEYRKLSGG